MLTLTDSTVVDLSRSDLVHGGGVFETVAVRQGIPLFLDRHLARMAQGLTVLGMPTLPENKRVRSFIGDFLRRRQLRDGALRLLAADGRFMVMIRPVYTPPPTARIDLTRQFHRCSGSALSGVKSAAYLENRMMTAAAQAQGLFDLIACNERNHLTDGGRCNVFLVFPDHVLTPPVSDGCLPGIVRELLLEQLPILPESIHRKQVGKAVAGWVTSSLAGVVPLQACGAQSMDPAHPLVRQARETYQALVAEEIRRFQV